MPERLDHDALYGFASALLDKARAAHVRIATAESCTGGLIAAALTEVPGSSDVFERGFVTYSNEAKVSDLGVPEASIAQHGAVSEEVACAMASGALAKSRTDLAVAVTGVAGPGGGSAAKPVGLVHIALTGRCGLLDHRECRFGDIGRGAIRRATVLAALEMLDAAIGRPPP